MATCFQVMFINGMALTHLVKYLVAVIINLWPLDEDRCISPIRSNPHWLKGHMVVVGCSSWVGACMRLLCIWHFLHLLAYSNESDSIVG